MGALFCFLCHHAAAEFVEIRDRTWNVSYGGCAVTPDNISYKVYPGFMFLGYCASEALMEDFYESSKEEPWKLLHFPSRQGAADQETAQLAAWFLPAHSTGLEESPLVVVVHGYGANGYDQSVQLVGHLLRSLGISVLVLNLRNHGLSSNTSTMYETLGWAYHLDVLGAWDYAVADPQGQLGRARPPSQVGVLGFSMGGLAVANALGMEPRIPAAWLDSALFDPREALRGGVAEVAGDAVASLGLDLSWWFVHRITGVNVDLRLPATSLALRHPRRHVALVANKADTTVTMYHAEHYLKAFQENSESYQLSMEYLVDCECTPETHVNIHVWRPDSYRLRLWSFWKEVFELTQSLPTGLVHFQQCATAQCPEAGAVDA